MKRAFGQRHLLVGICGFLLLAILATGRWTEGSWIEPATVDPEEEATRTSEPANAAVERGEAAVPGSHHRDASRSQQTWARPVSGDDREKEPRAAWDPYGCWTRGGIAAGTSTVVMGSKPGVYLSPFLNALIASSGSPSATSSSNSAAWRTTASEFARSPDPDAAIVAIFTDLNASAYSRNQALSLLIKSGSPGAFDVIVGVFERDATYPGTSTLVHAIAVVGDPRSASYLGNLLTGSTIPEQRRVAAAELGRVGFEVAAITALKQAARYDQDPVVRANAVRSIGLRAGSERTFLEELRGVEREPANRTLIERILA